MGLRGLKDKSRGKKPRKSGKDGQKSGSSFRKTPNKQSSGGRINGFVVGIIAAILLLVGIVFIARTLLSGDVANVIVPSSTPIDITGGSGGTTGISANTPLPTPPPTAVPTAQPSTPLPPPATTRPNPDVDMVLLEAARSNPAGYHIAYDLNITGRTTISGVTYTIELIGDGIASIDDTLESALFDGSFEGKFVTSLSPQEILFTLDTRIVDEAFFFRVLPITPGLFEPTPWYRLSLDEALGDLMDEMTDIDAMEEFPDIAELMRDFDFSPFMQTTQLPDEQGGTVAHYYTDIDVIAGLQSTQAQDMAVHIYNFMPEVIESLEENIVVEQPQADAQPFGDITEAEVRAGYVLMIGFLRRIVPVIRIQTHEYVNISERLVTGYTVDIDVQVNEAELQQMLGVQGLSNANLDVIINYSNHGGTFTVQPPESWVDAVLDDAGGIPVQVTVPD